MNKLLQYRGKLPFMERAAIPSTLIHLKPKREVSVSVLHLRTLGLAAQWLTQEESHKGAVTGSHLTQLVLKFSLAYPRITVKLALQAFKRIAQNSRWFSTILNWLTEFQPGASSPRALLLLFSC